MRAVILSSSPMLLLKSMSFRFSFGNSTVLVVDDPERVNEVALVRFNFRCFGG